MPQRRRLFLPSILFLSLALCQPAQAANPRMSAAKKVVAEILKRIAEKLAPSPKKQKVTERTEKAKTAKAKKPVVKKPKTKAAQQQDNQNDKKQLKYQGRAFEPLGDTSLCEGHYINIEHDQHSTNLYTSQSSKKTTKREVVYIDSLLFRVNRLSDNIASDVTVTPLMISSHRPGYSASPNRYGTYRVIFESGLYKVYKPGDDNMTRVQGPIAEMIQPLTSPILAPGYHCLFNEAVIQKLQSQNNLAQAKVLVIEWLRQQKQRNRLDSSSIKNVYARLSYDKTLNGNKKDPIIKFKLKFSGSGERASSNQRDELSGTGIICVDKQNFRLTTIDINARVKTNSTVHPFKALVNDYQTRSVTTFKYLKVVAK